MLRGVRLRLPGIAPYAEWCYGHHSRLLFDGEPLTSEAGVQQGDPLGPLLLSLALQPALRAVRSGSWDQQPELAFAYLDDVCLAGTLPQLRTALARLTAAARQVGLALNATKCKLITMSHDGLVAPSSFPAGLSIDRSGAFTLLAAAIGSSGYCTAHTQSQRVDASKPLLQALASLFRIMVCLRLRLPVASEDVACPLCNAVADRMGDHARACPCGGDRLRSILAARAQAGGLNPVVEKGGLLPPRLDFTGAPEDGVQAGGSPHLTWLLHLIYDKGLWLLLQQQGSGLQKTTKLASGLTCRRPPPVLEKASSSCP